MKPALFKSVMDGEKIWADGEWERVQGGMEEGETVVIFILYEKRIQKKK